MAIIRFKTRSLIRRFGSKPVEVSEALAKQYIDRRQAIPVKERITKVEEVKEELVEKSEEVEEKDQDSKEEELELKIKKPNKEKK